jgi:hypothetical protein
VGEAVESVEIAGITPERFWAWVGSSAGRSGYDLSPKAPSLLVAFDASSFCTNSEDAHTDLTGSTRWRAASSARCRRGYIQKKFFPNKNVDRKVHNKNFPDVRRPTKRS